MFCNACGQPLEPVAQFCSRCGAARPVVNPIAPPIPQPSHSVQGKKFLKWALFGVAAMVVIDLFGLRFGSLFKETTSSTTSEQHHEDNVPTKPLLDLNVLALHPRASVEKVIGKPLSYAKRTGEGEIGDTATYSWGRVIYAGDHLVAIQRIGPPHPYSAALDEFGLPGNSEPYVRDADETMLWNDRPFKSGIQSSQGLVIDSAFLPADFSEFHIWILDGYHPKSWTDDECVMWLRMSGSRIPEAAMQRGNMLYWPINHDNTPQACNSGGSTKY